MSLTKLNVEDQLLETANNDGVERISVGALIVRDHLVLLLRRVANDFLGGIDEIPGGGVELGETIAAAICREVQEETGLTVLRIKDYLGEFDYRSGSGRHTRQYNFVVEVGDGAPVVNPTEHESCFWVCLDDLERYRATESMLEILRAYARLA